MKKLLFQSCFCVVIALGALATACQKNPTTVSQRPTVSIEMGEISLDKVTATLLPSEGASKFEYALGLQSDESAFLDGSLLSIQTVLNSDPDFAAKTVAWTTDIDPDTYYVVYARAYDAAGNAGPLSMRGFNSATDDVKVELQYVSDVTAGFHITCTNDYYSYAFAFGLAADKETDLADFDGDILPGTVTVSDVYDNYINNFRLDSDGTSYALEPATDYVFYFKALDRSGGTTDIITIDFTTADENSVPNYTIEAGEMDFFMQHYTVTPNDLCSRVALWQNSFGQDYDDVIYGPYNYKGDYLTMLSGWADNNSPEAIKQNSVANPDFLTFSAIGEALEATPYTTNMELEQTVEVYVLCYNEMFEPVNVRKEVFTTPALNTSLPTPEASDFTVNVTKKIAGDLAFDISYTGDAVRAYYYEIVKGTTYDDEVEANGEESAKLTIRSKIVESSLFIYDEPESGTITYTGTDVIKGEKYYIAIAPMNANGPREGGWGEVVMHEFIAE